MKNIFKLFIFLVVFINFAQAKFLVQGATSLEISTLKKALKDAKREQIGAYEFYIGTVNGYEVVLSRTLVGAANVAAATALGIAHYQPDIVINQGIAGALVSGLKLGDILLTERIYNASAYTTKASAQLNCLERSDFLAPLTLLDSLGNESQRSFYTSDAELLKRAQELLNGARKGVIVSADTLNRQLPQLAHLHEFYGADMNDTQTAAAAQIASAFGVPFLGIKIISHNYIDNTAYEPQIAIKLQERLLMSLDRI